MQDQEKSRSIEELASFNRRCVQRFADSPFSNMVRRKELALEARRATFLACIQRFSTNFQTIMLTRQALCTDPRFARPFREHLREEIDHDLLIAERPGGREIEDATFIALSSWFSYQMVVLDNVEKAALVHLVLEEAGDHFHHLASLTLAEDVPSGYFETHAELDEGHAALGLTMLGDQSPATYERLHDVVDLGWRMIDAAAARVVQLVLAS